MIHSSAANSWPVDKKFDQLTEMIQSFTLFIYTLQGRTSISERNSKATIVSIIFNFFQPSGSISTQRLD